MDILSYIQRVNQLYGSEPAPMLAPRYNTQQYLQGGRVGMKPGGLVEPGVTHYGTEDWRIKQKQQAKNIKALTNSSGFAILPNGTLLL